LIEFNRAWHAKWANGSYYACCSEYLYQINGLSKYKIHYLHRWIYNDPPDTEIDHMYHKTLDNRKSQLRLTERPNNDTNRKSRNSNNKSGYRNVFWNKNAKAYVVQISIDGKNTRVGKFSDVDEAGAFAELKRKEIYGEYAGRS